jgi:hypothetical protein
MTDGWLEEHTVLAILPTVFRRDIANLGKNFRMAAYESSRSKEQAGKMITMFH